MLTAFKYNKYDKERFRRPISRKKRKEEEKERQQELQRARESITKWIKSLPDNNVIRELSESANQSELSLSGEEGEDSEESEESVELTGASGGLLNTAFQAVEEAESFNQWERQVSSPVKCEISSHNLIANRLRERNRSGITGAIKEKVSSVYKDGKDLKDKSVVGQIKLISGEAVSITSKCEAVCKAVNQDQEGDSRKEGATHTEMDIKFKAPPPTDVDDLKKQKDSEKMDTFVTTVNALCLKLAELDIQNNHETDGIGVRLNTTIVQMDKDTLEIAKLKQENGILKGLVQRQFTQINELNDKVTFLTARSMENNITITGIENDTPNEDCKKSVLEFMRQQMEIEANEEEILVAYRLGKLPKNGKKPRMMMVRCVQPLKERVMSNVANLKDKENSQGEGYYVNKQLPEKMMEQKREIRDTVKEVKTREAHLPAKEKTKVEVKNKVVYLDGEPVKKHIVPPQPLDLFPDITEKEKRDKIKMTSSDVVSERGSDFQAYAVKVSSVAEVQRAYNKVRELHPAATHVVAAYNLRNNKNGYQDDGEYGAGHRVLRIIQAQNNSNNVAVYIARAYGGI